MATSPYLFDSARYADSIKQSGAPDLIAAKHEEMLNSGVVKQCDFGYGITPKGFYDCLRLVQEGKPSPLLFSYDSKGQLQLRYRDGCSNPLGYITVRLTGQLRSATLSKYKADEFSVVIQPATEADDIKKSTLDAVSATFQALELFNTILYDSSDSPPLMKDRVFTADEKLKKNGAGSMELKCKTDTTKVWDVTSGKRVITFADLDSQTDYVDAAWYPSNAWVMNGSYGFGGRTRLIIKHERSSKPRAGPIDFFSGAE